MGHSAGALSSYLRIPVSRCPEAASRILYTGNLSPASGAADFLNGAITWTEQHPDRAIELCWIGEGDMQGVLRAQPLPANLRQRFAGPLTPGQIAGRMAQSGLLALPYVGRGWPPYLLEAMASGMVVLGSERNPGVRRLVLHQHTGWLFDPRSPASLLIGLNAALGVGAEPLHAMREQARARALGFQSRMAAPLRDQAGRDLGPIDVSRAAQAG